MSKIWRVIRLIPEYRGRTLAVLAVSLVLGAIGAGTPYIYKHIVDVIARLLGDDVSAAQAGGSVTTMIALFVVLRVAVLIFNFVQEKQSDDLWIDMVGGLRQRVFDNMTRLSIDYYERTRVGEIMDRFNGITQVTMWLRTLIEQNLANVMQMLVIVAVLAVKAPPVAALMIGVLLVSVTVSMRSFKVTTPYRRGWQRLAGRLSGLLAEMVSSIATVRSFGGEPAVKQRYDSTQAEWRGVRGKMHMEQWKHNTLINAVQTIAIILAVVWVTRGALGGRFTPGDILLVLMLSQNLINSVQPLTRLINQTGDIETNAERLMELIDADAEILDAPDAIDLDEIETLEFDRVSFAYGEQARVVLADVSFKLHRGQTLALVGLSGAGKTTIIKLLLRFYDPSSGRILVNGVDLSRYRQQSVRARLGVVLQDVALFNDSIEENIAFARPSSTPEEIAAAARAAHADEFIDALPEQYQTLVGERGIKLSGGEKQRIAIARATLKKPELIILDEATSALDSRSEHLVQAGLQRLMSGRTAVVIAHRLSTVMSADLILVLEGGRIVQRGTHATLVNHADGLYARLHSIQSGNRADLGVGEPLPV
ncbi:ABC transporter ATP-binding protein [Peristeroidobacter soli]|jgi:ABC-type multidrug transport system fused ATPase/permease subunit|uniref:ABC transporter ATP-binding protein n=1 Tax=Peristeroidobacter soli TaxID=2497877 RepID=UPI00101DA0D7|nr:ABC transporter ATP-binding protein [Peristeroidobacter soli]